MLMVTLFAASNVMIAFLSEITPIYRLHGRGNLNWLIIMVIKIGVCYYVCHSIWFYTILSTDALMSVFCYTKSVHYAKYIILMEMRHLTVKGNILTVKTGTIMNCYAHYVTKSSFLLFFFHCNRWVWLSRFLIVYLSCLWWVQTGWFTEYEQFSM